MRRTLVLAIATTMGCAVAPTPVRYAPDPATLYGAKAHRTAFEDPTTKSAAAPTSVGPAPRETDAPAPGDDVKKDQRTRTGLFWGGVALAAIGGASLLAFGVGGRVTQGQLAKGYDSGDLTFKREEQLRERGKVFNALAGAGAGVGLVGMAVAAIVYGIDYSRCGTLAKRRKDCKTK